MNNHESEYDKHIKQNNINNNNEVQITESNLNNVNNINIDQNTTVTNISQNLENNNIINNNNNNENNYNIIHYNLINNNYIENNQINGDGHEEVLDLENNDPKFTLSFKLFFLLNALAYIHTYFKSFDIKNYTLCLYLII